jgi:hypothetical protein
MLDTSPASVLHPAVALRLQPDKHLQKLLLASQHLLATLPANFTFCCLHVMLVGVASAGQEPSRQRRLQLSCWPLTSAPFQLQLTALPPPPPLAAAATASGCIMAVTHCLCGLSCMLMEVHLSA